MTIKTLTIKLDKLFTHTIPKWDFFSTIEGTLQKTALLRQ